MAVGNHGFPPHQATAPEILKILDEVTSLVLSNQVRGMSIILGVRPYGVVEFEVQVQDRPSFH